MRAPLAIAAIAFLLGAIGTIKTAAPRAYLSAALMMVIFFQGARLALVRFDPLLSSRELANLIPRAGPGRIIVDHHYYTFSSIAFYTGKLGFTLVADVPFGDGDRWIEVGPPGGGGTVAFGPAGNDFQPGRPTGILLSSPDPAADRAAIEQRAAVLLQQLQQLAK